MELTNEDGFPFTVLDGVISGRWEFIRPSTTNIFGPNYDYSGISAMCGPNGSLPLFPVKTLKIAAGSTIGFGVAGQTREGDWDESKNTKPVRSLSSFTTGKYSRRSIDRELV